MDLTYVRLLLVERELYRLPRDRTRFQAYLRLTIDPETKHIRLPTLGMNPMAKEHVAAFLDALLALDAEAVGEQAMREAAPSLAHAPGSRRVALVVHDDVAGGWTNRYACEYADRACPPLPPGQSYFDWLSVVLWASEPPTAELVREQVLTTLYRAAHIHELGHAATLGELMAQEGRAMARAGLTRPSLDAEDLEYTRWVLRPLLDATDMRTAIQALFGDLAGRTLGFPPLGLSPWAGLAVALHDARSRVDRPVVM